MDGVLQRLLSLRPLPPPPPPGPNASESSPDAPHTESRRKDVRGSGRAGGRAAAAQWFEGLTPPEARLYPRLYGGQLVAQALAAATLTTLEEGEDAAWCLPGMMPRQETRGSEGGSSEVWSKEVWSRGSLAAGRGAPRRPLLAHSLHASFVLPGDREEAVRYEVRRVRDGATFATRQVTAWQRGREIFFMAASFHRNEGRAARQGAPGSGSVGSLEFAVPMPGSTATRTAAATANSEMRGDITVEDGGLRGTFTSTCSTPSPPPPPPPPPPCCLLSVEEERMQLWTDARVPMALRR